MADMASFRRYFFNSLRFSYIFAIDILFSLLIWYTINHKPLKQFKFVKFSFTATDVKKRVTLSKRKAKS